MWSGVMAVTQKSRTSESAIHPSAQGKKDDMVKKNTQKIKTIKNAPPLTGNPNIRAAPRPQKEKVNSAWLWALDSKNYGRSTPKGNRPHHKMREKKAKESVGFWEPWETSGAVLPEGQCHSQNKKLNYWCLWVAKPRQKKLRK